LKIAKSKDELTITSVSYVNDREAGQKWFEIYIDQMLEELLKEDEGE
jgi:hypothetical protein